jgi:hypothetical protein
MSTLLAAITSPNSLCTADFIKLLECKVAAWKISVRSLCYLLWWINYFSSTCSQNLNSFGHREVGQIVFLKIVTTFTLVRLFVHNLYGNIVGVFWDGSTKNGLIHYHIGVGNVLRRGWIICLQKFPLIYLFSSLRYDILFILL